MISLQTRDWNQYNTICKKALFHRQVLPIRNPSLESIETVTDCIIYTIPIDELNNLYEKHIDIANWGRIIHQECNILLSILFVERLQLPPKERYARFLEHYPGLLNRVKLKYVAEFLGISIYTLSRIRSEK